MLLTIKVGSITNAQRGQRLLHTYGYKASIKRIENPSKAEGCGYALSLTANSNDPVKILQKNGVAVRGVDTDDISR